MVLTGNWQTVSAVASPFTTRIRQYVDVAIDRDNLLLPERDAVTTFQRPCALQPP